MAYKDKQLPSLTSIGEIYQKRLYDFNSKSKFSKPI